MSEVSHISQAKWQSTAFSALTQMDEHSSWFTRRAGSVYPLCREDLFPVWHLHTHTLLATPLVCPNNSGDRILSIQSTIIPLRAWEKHPISSFQNCSGYIFWQTLASDLTLSISPKISCCLVISFPNTYLYTSLPYNLKGNACETGRHSYSYNQWNCILLENRTGTTNSFPNGQMRATQTGNKQS